MGDVDTEVEESPHHPDKRHPLAFAYDGSQLIATAYDLSVAREWMEDGYYTVVWTPVGETKAEFFGVEINA